MYIFKVLIVAKHFSFSKCERYQVIICEHTYVCTYNVSSPTRGCNRAKTFLTFYKVTDAFRHGRPRHVAMTKANGNKNQLRRVSAVHALSVTVVSAATISPFIQGTTTIGRAAAFGFRRTITGRRVPDANFIPPPASRCLKPKARTKARALSYFYRGA